MSIAEVIAIGDELTSGQRLDTNSQWLSQQLGELGVSVTYHSTVADDLQAMSEVFRIASQRADFVVATGGLGPTADDLTRQALAEAAHSELVLDEPSLEHIQQLFQSRGRNMPERNRIQAMFPAGSRPIENPHGTAPGILIKLPRESDKSAAIFALPGVPAEMREMWHATVAPIINEHAAQRRVIRHRRLKCFGKGESHLEEMLPDLIRRGRQPTVGITVHAATITLRITAAGESADQCDQIMEPTIATIRDCLGNLVFGEEDDELHHAVVRLLRDCNKTLATAECGTSGRISHWLSELPEASGVFRGGMVASADESPDVLEGGRLLAENGARGSREQFAADYGLAVGPIATRQPGNGASNEFFFALATADDVIVRSSTTAGHPAILKDRAAKQALNLLRLQLLKM